MGKNKLVEIYEKVIQEIRDGFFINWKGERVKIPNSKLKKSVIYKDDDLKDPISVKKFDSCKIYVQNIDTFLKAIEMGENTAILNMANSKTPGGGVSRGAVAQEECLCRRSNLLYSLYSFTSWGDRLFKFRDDFNYPISTYGGIYSPKVFIYRDPSYKTYLSGFYTNVISAAAIIHPKYDPETLMIHKDQVHIVKRKIKSILRIALLNGNTKLVLGAFGCGAFCNPPKHVALLFKEVLESEEFKNAFEEICFAVLDDHNTGKDHNPEGNYKPFVEVFGE